MRSGQAAVSALLAFWPVLARAEEAAEGGSSMPQLDPTYYPSQIFWLVLTGVALYVVLARVALPRISAIVERRDTQVHADLEAAHQLKRQAEDIKIAYSKALRDADDEAQEMLQELVRDTKDRQASIIADAKGAADARLVGFEKALRADKEALLAQMPQMSKQLAEQAVTQLKRTA